MDSADVPQIDQELAIAIAGRDWARAGQLLDRGAQINRLITRTETFDRDVVDETSTYLSDASMAGDVETMEFLLKHGADPNIAGVYSGRTALHSAVWGGHAAAVDLLLAHAADVAAADRRYGAKTALGYALGNTHPAIVRSLLAAGAQGTLSELNFSIEGGAKAREAMRLLLEQGADINAVDDWGRTPIMWAAEYAEPETVGFMIERGADVNRMSEANSNGVNSHETALGVAQANRRRDVVALLQRAGARPAPWAGRNVWWKVLLALAFAAAAALVSCAIIARWASS